MHWEIQPLSKQSSISKVPFQEGEAVVCLLLSNEKKELLRYDVKPGEVDQLGEGLEIMGRWNRVVKSKEDEDRENQKQMLQSSEELFLSLFEEESGDDENRDVLKQILALLLERKRVLRALSKDRKGVLKYLHVKNRGEYEVSLADFPAEKLIELENQLQCVII